VNNRIKAFFGKMFLILGYIVLLPFALAIIVMLFFPPTWVPLLVVGGMIWFFMKDSPKKKTTGLLQIAGGSLFFGLILAGLVYMSDSKNSGNNATPQIPAVIAKSQTQQNKVQKSTAGPTLTAESELKHQEVAQTSKSGKTEDVVFLKPDAHGNVIATAGKIQVSATEEPKEESDFNIEGETAQVKAGADGFPCWDSTESMNKFTQASIDNDHYAMNELVEDHSYQLNRGITVRHIGSHGFLGSEIHLRLEGGSNAGADCWEAYDQNHDFFEHIRLPQRDSSD